MLVKDPNADAGLPQPQYDPDRERRWVVHFIGGTGADPVIVRHYAVLTPGEDLTENPPSHELTWDEWVAGHAEYGLTLDGQPTE
jgi:hypothetical protein